MTKYLTEMLDEMNSDKANFAKYQTCAALKILLEYAFDPEKKFVLPDGDPPFKPDAGPLGMSPANLLMEVKRFYVFCRKDLKPIKRETLFVQLLENIHPTEAKLMLHVKDQTLPKLYPKLTHKVLFDAGFIAVEPVAKASKPAKKAETQPAGVSP